MRVLSCVVLMLALVGTALAAGQDTKPIQVVSDAFIKAIVDNNFDAYKALTSTKLQAEFAKNSKNCMIKRWWDAARDAIDKHQAKYEYTKVKSNMPTIVTLEYKRTMDSGEGVVPIELVKEGDKWAVDSAGAL
jgi:hypothetical protein